jgi:hypothetical protein
VTFLSSTFLLDSHLEAFDPIIHPKDGQVDGQFGPIVTPVTIH